MRCCGQCTCTCPMSTASAVVPTPSRSPRSIHRTLSISLFCTSPIQQLKSKAEDLQQTKKKDHTHAVRLCASIELMIPRDETYVATSPNAIPNRTSLPVSVSVSINRYRTSYKGGSGKPENLRCTSRRSWTIHGRLGHLPFLPLGATGALVVTCLVSTRNTSRRKMKGVKL